MGKKYTPLTTRCWSKEQTTGAVFKEIQRTEKRFEEYENSFLLVSKDES